MLVPKYNMDINSFIKQKEMCNYPLRIGRGCRGLELDWNLAELIDC